jgi:ABC-2 type transport system permease protein
VTGKQVGASKVVAVARKELREWSRDGRLRWLAFACLALMCVAALSGLQVTLGQIHDQAVASGRDHDNFLAQGAKNPHAAAHYGQYAFRPVLLPAAIDPGVSAYMGSMVWMEAHRQNLPEFRPAEDSAAFGRATRLSVAWVLQFVVPLFVIVLGFAAVAGERERGTLALALSQGLSLRALLAGKALAGTGTLLAMLLPLALLVVLLFSIAAPKAGTVGAGARLGWMGLAYLAWLAGFAGLALLVSLLTRTRRNAFFVLVALWLAMTVALPRLAADLAASAHPTPTPTAFWAAIRRGDGAAELLSESPDERTALVRGRLEGELLARHGVERLQDLPVNFTAVLLQRLEEKDAPVFDHNYGELWATYDRQRRFQRSFALLAPVISLRAVSMALAGADPYAQQHFATAAEQHRRAFVGELNALQAREGAGTSFFVAPAESWANIPLFHYEPPAPREALARHGVDLGILLAWALGPLFLALWLAGRVRPLA